jgi:putative DNA primase/helicase
MRFLAEVLAPADVERALELAGYLVMPDNPLHRPFLLYGSGRNGKGVFLRTMTELLGEANVSAVALHDLAADRFMPAKLFGRTANLAGDIDATYIERTGQLKAMSGDDVIMAQHKFRRAFRLTPRAVSVFSANKILSSSDSSHGWLARWEVLPFPVTFAAHDPGLEPGLRSELDGIAAGAVGFLRLLDKVGSFTRTAEGAEAKAMFATGQDPLSYWLEECTRDDAGEWVSGRRRSPAIGSGRCNPR